MLLSEPSPTPADLLFRLGAFPVRISVWFWVLILITGRSSPSPVDLVIWAFVVFISILIHELGHALLQYKFGGWPRIVLHGFGGLAICSDGDRSPRKQILISLAGPAAGFLLAGMVLLVLYAAAKAPGFAPYWYQNSGIPDDHIGFKMLIGDLHFAPFSSPVANELVRLLLFVNLLWGLVNLLPIYPLDGGQIARELFAFHPDVRKGIVLSYWVSIITAAAWSIIGGIYLQSLLVAIMFGLFAFSNYQGLQAYTGRGPSAGW